jgi:hypothetical protein
MLYSWKIPWEKLPMPNQAASSKVNVPTIVCVNKANTPLGVDFDALVAAMQVFVDEHVAPVWGTPAKLVKSSHLPAGHWSMVFLDHADHAHSLAIHDLTPDGMPLARVFVATTLKHDQLVSVAASHELVEMLVDPSINLVTMHPHSNLVYGYESADPVEELTFPVNGIQMTNFVYPTYFESFHKPGSVQFDHMRAIAKPFQIHAGGYQGVYKGGKWVALFGSPQKEQRFSREDRRGHRSEQRAATDRLKTAAKHADAP